MSDWSEQGFDPFMNKQVQIPTNKAVDDSVNPVKLSGGSLKGSLTLIGGKVNEMGGKLTCCAEVNPQGATGKRIELSSTGSNLKIYDANNNLITEFNTALQPMERIILFDNSNSAFLVINDSSVATTTGSPLIVSRVTNTSSVGACIELDNQGDGAHIYFNGDPNPSVGGDGWMWFDGTDLKMRMGDTVHKLLRDQADETIDGEWTFSVFPITPSAAPDADYEVANKKYVDDEIAGLDVPEYKFAGVGAISKTYYNFVLNLKATDTSDTNVTPDYYAGGNSLSPTGGNWSVITADQIFSNNYGGSFTSGKAIIVEFGAVLGSVAESQSGFGLMEGTAPVFDYDEQTDDAVCFTMNAGDVYAHTADEGTGHTEVAISGITATNLNLYRIEFDPGVNAKFYVNGVLKATITTNLPETRAVLFAFGSSAQAGGVRFITNPHFSIEI